jgi:hypothetical protein
LENLKGRDYLGNTGIYGRIIIILKNILKWCQDVDRIQYQAINMVMNLLVP